MNRLEAFKFLKENPDKELKVVKGYQGTRISAEYILVKNNTITYKKTGNEVPFFIDDEVEFEIVKRRYVPRKR